MNITSIIIVITFLAAIAEKFSNKPPEERKGILKRIKLENIAILLLGILLTVQLVDSIQTKNDKELEEAKNKEAYEKISNTQLKVNAVNLLIDSVLINLKNEIAYTKEEVGLIKGLNDDMNAMRLNIKNTLSEYQKLNTQYSEQLALERKKIKNAKPDVRVLTPKSTFDSINVSYQYQLINYGARIADSVEFESVMILVDTNSVFSKTTILKSNLTSHNTLSLPPNKQHSYIANSLIASKVNSKKYVLGYLLVKYRYYDNSTDYWVNEPTQIFMCTSITKGGGQYRQNIKEKTVNLLKKYLHRRKPKLNKIFFE